MNFTILTLFPEMFQGPLSESLLKKAQDRSLLSFNLVNLREFATDKHKTADDTPYGGGPGMVMKPELVAAAISKIKEQIRLRQTKLAPSSKTKVILMTPVGKTLTQEKVNQLAKEKHLVILCGHYEGIDERVRRLVDEELSIGDYVLTGGELPAMVLIDAVARHIPGVVKEAASVENDSFYCGLLDYPSYTKPEDFGEQKVPEVLRSGHHAEIASWRRKEALRRTIYRRPDLLAKIELNHNDMKMLEEIVIDE